MLIELFKELNMKDYIEIIESNYQMNKILNNNLIFQYGGIKRTEINFEGYNFTIFQEDNRIYIARNNDIDSSEYCMDIIIDKKEHIASLHNISYYKECSDPELKYPGGGGILLKLALKILKNNKEKLGINKVQLQDNSFFYCEKTKKNIQLPLLYTLINGHTWYGKYGFRPFNFITMKPDEEFLRLYERNYEIINNTKIKDTTLFQHIEKKLKQKIPNDVDLLEKMLNSYKKKFENKTIGYFF